MLLRSMMFVPAYNEKYIEKALESEADALILDLEDSVPDSRRLEARKTIRKYIDAGKLRNSTVFVRVNSIESNLPEEDFKYVIHKDITGFMLPKICSEKDIEYYDKLITELEIENNIEVGHFKFAVLIETAMAIINLYNIAKQSPRNVALCFGGEDFITELGGMRKEPAQAFEYPRSMISIAAKAANIQAIDTPYFAVHNYDGFITEESLAIQLGYTGILVLSPRQIPLANRCFTPDEEEVRRSKEIIEACIKTENEGAGVVIYNGKMVGPPAKRRAQKILEIMDMIERKSDNG